MIVSGSTTYDLSSKLVQSINKILDHKWSHRQIAEGKKIRIPPEWGIDVISFTCARYQKLGWSVRRLVELSAGSREYYLEFKNPNWKKYNDQFSPD